MPASFNRVVLLGNLTRDPELRYIPSGTAVSEIGLAVNDRVKRDGQWVDEATFVDVTLWGRTAEVANEYLSKGSSVLIEGRLKLDQWENKEGEKRSKLKVVCERMQMVGSKGEGGGGGSRGTRPQQGAPASSYQSHDSGSDSGMPDDDIPF
jgi:single-strand DNA-binding protein